jgi:hypothetical protein
MILLQGLSVLLVFVSILPPAALAADFACNVLQDSCPTTYNGVCESEYGTNQAACLKGDCGDCDQCVQFSFDCQGCTSNGCYFCPGDATCYNSNLYTITGAVASCNVPSEYTTDTCQNSQSDQFFEYVLCSLIREYDNDRIGLNIFVRVCYYHIFESLLTFSPIIIYL